MTAVREKGPGYASQSPLVVDARSGALSQGDLERVVEHVRAGGVLVYPTETVYGFGSLVRGDGFRAIREFKSRSDTRPMLVLLPDTGFDAGLRWTQHALALTGAYWPGPLTLVLEDPESGFPEGVRSAEGSVGVRVSSSRIAGAVARALGEPLISTSANLPGEAPARSGEEALGVARALAASAPDASVCVIDGGPSPSLEPSTVVACGPGGWKVLREGVISRARIEKTLEGVPGAPVPSGRSPEGSE